MFGSSRKLLCLISLYMGSISITNAQSTATPFEQIYTGMSQAEAVRILGADVAGTAIVNQFDDERVVVLLTKKGRFYQISLDRKLKEIDNCQLIFEKYLEITKENNSYKSNNYCRERGSRSFRINMARRKSLHIVIRDRVILQEDGESDKNINFMVGGFGFCGVLF